MCDVRVAQRDRVFRATATVTLGIGAAPAHSGRKVLLIDLDPQVSATKVMGVDVEDRCTVADAMLEPERFWPMRAVVETGWGSI
jgi:hypothetical protein